MRAREFLFDNKIPVVDNLASLKSVIVHKIKDLPEDEQTANSLGEIEDILGAIPLGGRKQTALADFGSWTDKDVQEAKTILAKYVVSLDAPISEKRSMLAQWKESGLIDIDILLNGNRNAIDQIVKGYATNTAVQELADDLIQVSSLGKGKGEFMLKVLSPIINEPPSGKGDIEVVGIGTVEVKTTDSGAGRFTDRQVKPGNNYQSAVNSFMKAFEQFLTDEEPVQQPVVQQPLKPMLTKQPELFQDPNDPQGQLFNANGEPIAEAAKAPAKPKALSSKTGLNISQLIALYKKIPEEKRLEFIKRLTKVLEEIFVSVPQYVGAVITSITSGNSAKSKQLYGVACLNNYIAQKDDKGILYISLVGETTFTFFTDNESLNAAGMRLNIGTAYPVTSDMQMAYPQTVIVNTVQEQPSL